jgi:hypothetical protein
MVSLTKDLRMNQLDNVFSIFTDKEELKKKRDSLVRESKNFEGFDRDASSLFGYGQASNGGIRFSYWNAAIEAAIKVVENDRSIPYCSRNGVARELAALKAKK